MQPQFIVLFSSVNKLPLPSYSLLSSSLPFTTLTSPLPSRSLFLFCMTVVFPTHTYYCMIICSICLSGVPLSSQPWSSSHSCAGGWCALMTAAYICSCHYDHFQQVLYVFMGAVAGYISARLYKSKTHVPIGLHQQCACKLV